MSLGIMVGGPATITSAPIFLNPAIFDRATLLCAISPIMARRSPLRFPFFSLTVIISRSAWEGWAWVPSPAFIIDAFSRGDNKCGAPDEEWRITIISAFIASRYLPVSIRVSPLTMLLLLADIDMLSALRLLAAISKDDFVLVLGS